MDELLKEIAEDAGHLVEKLRRVEAAQVDSGHRAILTALAFAAENIGRAVVCLRKAIAVEKTLAPKADPPEVPPKLLN